jgi:phosphate-selective porin OprO/OprP
MGADRKSQGPAIAAGIILILVALSSANANEGEVWQAFSYGSKGMQYESADANNFLWFGVRLQTRFSSSAIEDEEVPGHSPDKSSETKLNRGRLKIGGHLITPDFTVYSEYDFTKDQLLDLRMTYKLNDWLSVRVGQWKSQFNRERIDSSGAQQFVERSIATPWFTIDRQKGVVVSGHLAEGDRFDSNYWFGRLSGTGRGGSLDDADGLWMGRWQWNFTRRVLGFSQSDISRREKPAGSIAIAAVSGASMFTRFSSAGGGQLPGYSNGTSDRYEIRQIMVETAWQHSGLSWQQEFHRKEITDRTSGLKQKITGGYAQAGLFLSEVWNSAPEPLELALRYASINAEEANGERDEQEYVFGVNWFFNGHRNKLSADVSHLDRRDPGMDETESRVRIQWDVSF